MANPSSPSVGAHLRCARAAHTTPSPSPTTAAPRWLFFSHAVSSRPPATHFLLALLIFYLNSNSAIAQKNLPAQPVNLNTATIAQLETLPGIGPSTAKSIVDFREKSGPFQSVEDLLAIKGISKAKLEKLRPYVTIGPPPKSKQQSNGPHRASFSSSNFQEAV